MQIIYSMFPIKYDRYIEVFGGSGAVLLGKKNKDKFEVYDDFNYNLVNLFRCIKSRPNALIMELGFCNLNARDDFNTLVKFFKDEKFDDRFMNEELELTKKIFKDIDTSEYTELFTRRMLDYDVRRAAMFLKVLRYSYSSGCKSFGGQPYDIRKLFKLIQDVSIRLNETVIENQSYEVLIPHYDRDDSFFYCDPPYYTSEYVYSCGFTEEMHLLLRDILMNIRGSFYSHTMTAKKCVSGTKAFISMTLSEFTVWHKDMRQEKNFPNCSLQTTICERKQRVIIIKWILMSVTAT